MSLKPWQEAKLLLSNQNLGQYYFQLKTEAYKARLENYKFKQSISTIHTKQLISKFENSKAYLAYTRYDKYNQTKAPCWYKEFKLNPIEELVNILKIEIDNRPPPPSKRNRKQMRQDRAKKNRSFGRGKNR